MNHINCHRLSHRRIIACMQTVPPLKCVVVNRRLFFTSLFLKSQNDEKCKDKFTLYTVGILRIHEFYGPLATDLLSRLGGV